MASAATIAVVATGPRPVPAAMWGWVKVLSDWWGCRKPASASMTTTAISIARKTPIMTALSFTSRQAISATRIIIPAAIQLVDTLGASELT